MNEKAFGQVFTPKAIVIQMLDTVGYAENHDILTKKIMEPSFGEGVFLKEIVSRLVAAAKKANYPTTQISEILGQNIYGIELDPILYRGTLNSLNSLVKNLGLPPVKWKLEQGDTLLFKETYENTFDFVVGNPPYVRIHNIPDAQRQAIKNFRFATGTTDLYIVFFELGLDFLTSTGKLAYITPNSFMKNHSQKNFRQHLVKNRILSGLSDYRSEKIFNDADTYATITYLSQEPNERITYSLIENSTTVSSVISYEVLNRNPGAAWNFSDPGKIMEKQALLPNAIEDVMSVQYGIATLRDKIYIDNTPVIGDTTTLIHGHPVENGILRPVVKGSTYKGEEIQGRVIFPYQKVEGKYVIIEEEYLRSTFPLAYEYLSSHRDELALRSMEKNSRWYQYGRSQGLNASDSPKLVFGHVIKPSSPITTYLLPAGVVVYSGFFAVPQPHCDTAVIRKHLETSDFSMYAQTVGKDMSGGFVAITAKNLKAYRF